MKERRLEAASGTCRIALGAPLEDLSVWARGRRTLLVTDRNVLAAQGHRFPSMEVVEVGLGEASKTLATVEALYRAFLEREIDRGCLVVGIGGGIVCDLTGYAASTYQRGLSLGFVPTTLLAQADAALGGKNGVNFHGYKNLVGMIRQPEFVLVDPSTLATLPVREIACGLAEVVKAGAIADETILQCLDAIPHQTVALDPAHLTQVLGQAMEVKLHLVQMDESESGPRMLLNFGHTLGHALEAISDGRWAHGEAVALGMVAAARISVAKGLLALQDAKRLEHLLDRLGLPTFVGSEHLEAALGVIRHDKKRRGNLVHWVLLEGLGRGVIHALDLGEAEAILRGHQP